MAKKKATSKKNELTFEDAMSQLEAIVARLEDGGESLEKSLGDYARATELMKVCHAKLEQAERKIEMLSGVDADGNPVLERVDDREQTLEERRLSRSQRRSSENRTGGESQSTPGELF